MNILAHWAPPPRPPLLVRTFQRPKGPCQGHHSLGSSQNPHIPQKINNACLCCVLFIKKKLLQVSLLETTIARDIPSCAQDAFSFSAVLLRCNVTYLLIRMAFYLSNFVSFLITFFTGINPTCNMIKLS